MGNESERGFQAPEKRLTYWSDRLFIIAILIFIAFLIPAAPEFGETRLISGVAIGIITVLIAYKVYRKQDRHPTKRFSIGMIATAILIISACGTFGLMYVIKYDTVMNDIPSSGFVRVRMDTDAQCYSDSPGSAVNISVSIVLDGDAYDEDDIFLVEIDREYSLRTIVSYVSSNYKKAVAGHTDSTIIFQAGDFADSEHSYSTRVNIDNTLEYANATVEFKRVAGFWDVVLE